MGGSGDALLPAPDLARLPPRGRRPRRGDAQASASPQRGAGAHRAGIQPQHPRGRAQYRVGPGGPRGAAGRLRPGPSTGRERQGDDHHRLSRLRPVPSYARSEAAREKLWRVYRQRAHPKNLSVLARMLEKRYELATLLGYPSWAAYVTEDKMIGSAQAAADFIARISAAAEKRADSDYQALLERKRRDDPGAGRVEAWDSQVLTEALRKERHGYDAQSVRPYFEMSRVQDGVLEVTSRLFGLEYRRLAGAPVWHPDVACYDVVERGEVAGRFYLDLHPRDGKYKHAAQFTLQSGQAGKRLPEAALVCNFPRPGSLLEHSEVVTFFHAFGHLLHHLLGGRTRWAGIP